MSLNMQTSNKWNYSNKDKPGYSLVLTGTVVAIQDIQALDFKSKLPKTWPNDGHPVWNARMGFAMPDGSLKTFEFQKGSRKTFEEQRGLHYMLWKLSQDMGLKDTDDLIGHTITIMTREAGTDENGNPIPNMPTAYSSTYPRWWHVESADNQGVFQLNAPMPDDLKVPQLLRNDGASGGQIIPQQTQPIQVPAVQYQQPIMTQQVQPQVTQSVQQVQPQVTQAAPVQGQMVPVGSVGPAMVQQPAGTVQPTMPAGMDPSIAAAMQNLGAVNVQPVVEGGSVYDEDCPF